MNIIDETYMGKIQINSDMIIVSLWNRFIENRFIEIEGGTGCKVFPNDEKFFENSFASPVDIAWAASGGNYHWTDEFVYIDAGGNLMSFSRLDDKTCPIDLDKINISSLIQELQELEDLKNKNKKGYVNNIPKAIHDALQEN